MRNRRKTDARGIERHGRSVYISKEVKQAIRSKVTEHNYLADFIITALLKRLGIDKSQRGIAIASGENAGRFSCEYYALYRHPTERKDKTRKTEEGMKPPARCLPTNTRVLMQDWLYLRIRDDMRSFYHHRDLSFTLGMGAYVNDTCRREVEGWNWQPSDTNRVQLEDVKPAELEEIARELVHNGDATSWNWKWTYWLMPCEPDSSTAIFNIDDGEITTVEW